MKVLKFGAVWCPGCLVMKPRWLAIEKKNPWLETEYFEYDDCLEDIKKYKVGDTLPVFIFLDKTGQEILRLRGEIPEEEILEILEKYKDN